MPKRLFTSVIIVFLYMAIGPFHGHSQTSCFEFGARSGAMGHSTLGLTDFWSVQSNQAGLAELRKTSVGFGYNQHFAISELAEKYLAVVLPAKHGVFAVNYSYSGYSLYRESKAGIAFGKKLGQRFSMGLQLDYFNNHMAEGYGSAHALSFQLGLHARLNNQLVLGVHAFNPIQAKWSGSNSEKIPDVFTLGLAYSLSKELTFVLETEKDMDYKPLLRGGVEYEISPGIFSRIGYSSVPARADANTLNVSSEFTFGFGLHLKHFVADLSAGWHQILGWTPHVSFVYQFNSREKKKA